MRKAVAVCLPLLLATGCPVVSDCILIDPEIEQPELYWVYNEEVLTAVDGRLVSESPDHNGGYFYTDASTIPFDELREILPGKHLLFTVVAYIESGQITIEYYQLGVGRLDTAVFLPEGGEHTYTYLVEYVPDSYDVPSVSPGFVGYIERFDLRIVELPW